MRYPRRKIPIAAEIANTMLMEPRYWSVEGAGMFGGANFLYSCAKIPLRIANERVAGGRRARSRDPARDPSYTTTLGRSGLIRVTIS